MALAHHHPRHNVKSKISRLRTALILTVFGAILEFAGGLVSNSLALISDAGHMLTHVFALGTSYLAILLTLRPATKKRTYGLYRAEVLAAFVNGIFLIFIALYIFYEAVKRFIHPEPINIAEMLGIALIGLLINGTSTFLLARVRGHDLNIRSAFYHEIGDMISSVAVVGAGILILITKNYAFDPALSFVICGLIVVWAAKLLVDSANILLEATPPHLDVDDVVRAIQSEIPEVHEVHHVHAWTITSSMYALTAHIVIEDCHVSSANKIVHRVNQLVKERFHIEHTNLQFECLVKQPKADKGIS